jgi:hypothetical protein
MMRETVTFEVGDGRYLTVRARDLKTYGLEELMKAREIAPPTERVDVYHLGKKIGSVPGSFDPLTIRSTSFFYDPRPGDFVREGDKWIASPTLGPGDIEAIDGFVLERPCQNTSKTS